MKLKTTKVATLAAILITIGSLAGRANSAIVVDINVNTFNVRASGSYTLFDATSSDANSSNIRITTSTGGWNWVTDGAGTPLSPNLGGTIFSQLNFAAGLFTWEIQDVSNGNSILAAGDITGLSFNPNSTFVGFDGGTITIGARDAAVDAGDLLVVSADFTLGVAESADVANLALGTHTSSYNGENLTLNISVPEPSSALLLGLGALGLVFRRKRTA